MSKWPRNPAKFCVALRDRGPTADPPAFGNINFSKPGGWDPAPAWGRLPGFVAGWRGLFGIRDGAQPCNPTGRVDFGGHRLGLNLGPRKPLSCNEPGARKTLK